MLCSKRPESIIPLYEFAMNCLMSDDLDFDPPSVGSPLRRPFPHRRKNHKLGITAPPMISGTISGATPSHKSTFNSVKPATSSAHAIAEDADGVAKAHARLCHHLASSGNFYNDIRTVRVESVYTAKRKLTKHKKRSVTRNHLGQFRKKQFFLLRVIRNVDAGRSCAVIYAACRHRIRLLSAKTAFPFSAHVER
jgi:hypothetical protein